MLACKCTNADIGIQQLRIMSLLAAAKVHGLHYSPTKMCVSGNTSFDPEWNDKWSNFFNISGHSTCVSKYMLVDYLSDNDVTSTEIEHLRQHKNVLLLCPMAFKLANSDPNMYYGSIIDEVRGLYHQTRKPIISFERDVVNIVIAFDRCTDVGISSTECTKLIDYLSYKHFPVKIHKVTYGNRFAAFHTMVSADVLVCDKTAFSYLAGLYNSNTVIYFPFHHASLSRWQNALDLINAT